MGTCILAAVQVIARPILRAFAVQHPTARGPLATWFAEAKRAQWKSMAEIRGRYATASVLNHERVVFNIHGNDFRLVVFIRFKTHCLFIRFIGSHRQYDTINALEI